MLVNDHYTNLPLGPRSGEDHEALSAKAGKAGTADSISSTDENLDKTVMPTWCPLLRRQEICKKKKPNAPNKTQALLFQVAT